jgi:hypothetical protein
MKFFTFVALVAAVALSPVGAIVAFLVVGIIHILGKVINA